MSCDEWERGDIKLPTKDYPKFRKEISAAWNEYNLLILDTCKKMLPELKLELKKSKESDFYLAVHNVARRHTSLSDHAYDTICDLVIARQANGKLGLRSPKKSDLKLCKISEGGVINFEEACIIFDDKSSSVTWSVQENNRSVGRARSHPIAKKLFSKLETVNWVRGTGGEIVGNDEYNRDDYGAGGGGNYVTSSYGPAYARPKRSYRS